MLSPVLTTLLTGYVVLINNTFETVFQINQLNGDPVGPFQNSYSDMMKVLNDPKYDDNSAVPGDIGKNGFPLFMIFSSQI